MRAHGEQVKSDGDPTASMMPTLEVFVRLSVYIHLHFLHFSKFLLLLLSILFYEICFIPQLSQYPIIPFDSVSQPFQIVTL